MAERRLGRWRDGMLALRAWKAEFVGLNVGLNAGPGPGGAGVKELECWASGEECGARSSRMLGWEE